MNQTIRHVDKKRWLWMLAVIYPLQPFISIGMHAKTGNEAWFIYPFIYIYIIAPIITPIINRILRDDGYCASEAIVMQLDQDVYNRRLIFIVVPLHFITLFGTVWYATTQPLSTWAFVLLAIYAGMVAGLAINTGHELGHKSSKIEKQGLSGTHIDYIPWLSLLYRDNPGIRSFLDLLDNVGSAELTERIKDVRGARGTNIFEAQANEGR